MKKRFFLYFFKDFIINLNLKIFKILIIFVFLIFLSSCANKNIFSIHTIDVGQGDSILIHTDDNKNILIDCGDENAEHTVYSYLKRNGVNRIDMLFASHSDTDHIGSMDYIIDKIQVSKLYLTEGYKENDAFNNMIKSCKNNNVKIEFIKKGDSFRLNDYTTVNILSPSHTDENVNLNSSVLLINYKDKKLLFMGDAEEENEREILSDPLLTDVDFLKAGHHGSSSSSIPEFIEKIKPEIVTISCGYRNDYGHPHKSVLDTFRKNNSSVFRTDINGSIAFYIDENGFYSRKKYISE